MIAMHKPQKHKVYISVTVSMICLKWMRTVQPSRARLQASEHPRPKVQETTKKTRS